MNPQYPWRIIRHPGHSNQKVHGRKKGGIAPVAVQPSLFDAPRVTTAPAAGSATSTAEAAAYAEKTFGITKVNYEGMDLDVANSLNKRLSEYVDDGFGDVIADFNYLGVGSTKALGEVWQAAGAKMGYNKGESALKFFEEDFAIDDTSDATAMYAHKHATNAMFNSVHGIWFNAADFRPKNVAATNKTLAYQDDNKLGLGRNAVDTLDHEMGHAIAYSRGVGSSSNSLYLAYKPGRPERLRKLVNLWTAERKNDDERPRFGLDARPSALSNYGFSQYSEFIAEAWTAHKMDPSHPIGRQVAELISPPLSQQESDFFDEYSILRGPQ